MSSRWTAEDIQSKGLTTHTLPNGLQRRTTLKRTPLNRHKYGAKPGESNGAIFPELAGRRFDSKLERSVAEMLVMRQRAGEISDLKFQNVVTMTKARIKWRVDFAYTETSTGIEWHHEAKGLESQAYRIQLKLFKHYGPGPVRITKGKPGNLKTTEHWPEGE